MLLIQPWTVALAEEKCEAPAEKPSEGLARLTALAIYGDGGANRRFSVSSLQGLMFTYDGKSVEAVHVTASTESQDSGCISFDLPSGATPPLDLDVDAASNYAGAVLPGAATLEKSGDQKCSLEKPCRCAMLVNDNSIALTKSQVQVLEDVGALAAATVEGPNGSQWHVQSDGAPVDDAAVGCAIAIQLVADKEPCSMAHVQKAVAVATRNKQDEAVRYLEKHADKTIVFGAKADPQWSDKGGNAVVKKLVEKPHVKALGLDTLLNQPTPWIDCRMRSPSQTGQPSAELQTVEANKTASAAVLEQARNAEVERLAALPCNGALGSKNEARAYLQLTSAAVREAAVR